MEDKKTGLQLLREPFSKNHISQLPKPTKAQTDAVKKDFKTGIRCKICGGWHHPKVIHLDYVGHAALTDRLLDCDPEWNWKPIATTEAGLPAFDNIGGLWIYLTVNGVTRMGYGSADNKQGGDAIKEIIGDALRNAAMRFGAALDLWHKGSLHGMDDVEVPIPDTGKKPAPKAAPQKVAPKVDMPKFIATMDKMQKTLGQEMYEAILSDHGVESIMDVKDKNKQIDLYNTMNGLIKKAA